MKAEDPGSEVLEIDINNGHVGHLSGLRLGLESEVFMLDIEEDVNKLTQQLVKSD